MQLAQMKSCHAKADQVRASRSIATRSTAAVAVTVVVPLLLFQVYSFTDENVAAAQTLLQAHVKVNAVDTVRNITILLQNVLAVTIFVRAIN
jgi:hypothetical protein